MRVVEAVRLVPAAPEAVFAFLADLSNHWELADRAIEVVTLDRPGGGPARGGRVRLRGPLGVGRTATTRVERTEPPTLVAGTATLGPRTRAQVSWHLTAEGEGTRVRLVAEVEAAGALDGLLLALGGRVWLARRFGGILDRLAARMAASGRPRSRPRERGAGRARATG